MARRLEDYTIAQLIALMERAYDYCDFDRFCEVVKVMVDKGDLRGEDGACDDMDIALAFYAEVMRQRHSEKDLNYARFD